QSLLRMVVGVKAEQVAGHESTRAGCSVERPDSSSALTLEMSIRRRMIKTLSWLGSSRSEVRNFPAGSRRRVREIRVHSAEEHRVLYVAKFEEAIYVLYAFEKKTQKTAKADLELAGFRLRELLKIRAQATGVRRKS